MEPEFILLGDLAILAVLFCGAGILGDFRKRPPAWLYVCLFIAALVAVCCLVVMASPKAFDYLNQYPQDAT